MCGVVLAPHARGTGIGYGPRFTRTPPQNVAHHRFSPDRRPGRQLDIGPAAVRLGERQEEACSAG